MQDFFNSFFAFYNIATEIAMILVVVVFKGIIFFSNPEKTKQYKVLHLGLMFAFLIMVLHIMLLGETIIMRTTHRIIFLNIIYTLYSIFYVLELICILIYQNQLSFKRRIQHKGQLISLCFLALLWLVLLLTPMFNHKLVEYKDGNYLLTTYSDAYVLCSFICGIVMLIITILNRNDVSRIVYYGSIVFGPIIILVTIAQFHFHNAYFICATYTLPFIIYFTLFHSNKYNDISGCQGYDAYKTYLNDCIDDNCKFIHITAIAPKLTGRNLSGLNDIIIYMTNNLSRSIEKVDKNIRVYNLAADNYVIVCKVQNDSQGERIVKKLISLMSDSVIVKTKSIKMVLNTIISTNYDNITNADEYVALVNQKTRQFQNLDSNQTLYITEEDVIKYKKNALLEKCLFDIKQNDNLDDERILLYVQPIHDINKNEFRTGESLMRLKIDGTLYFPDDFIPIAESIDCIHTLTRVILHKVSKLTVQMNKEYDFDALTVNVSTIEMTSPTVVDEFMTIIKNVGAKPENIRMEITESTSINNYDQVITNIKKLKEMGISFYLDDFGTGYSNMDRVLSIPFKTIKFDKSLMYKAIEDKTTEELFLFLANYFKKNGLSLVTEGVENDEHRNFVTSAGFDYIQGYYYSKPLPAEEALEKFSKLK